MRLLSVVCSTALAVAGAAAHADTISTFSLTSTFNNNGGAFSGDIVVNTTTGKVTSADLTAKGFPSGLDGTYNQVLSQNPDFFGEPVYAILIEGKLGGLDLVLPGTSLVGYKGSGICLTANSPCANNYDTTNFAGFYGATSGKLTLVSSVTTAPPPPVPTATTPEPASVALLGTGLVGLAGVLRRRLQS